MRKPTVHFISGFPRTGSTWLFYNLKKNNIHVPDIKEVQYYDKNYSKGIEWYKSHFINNKTCFDLSITYALNQTSLKRIKNDFPHSKHFLIIRDPLERDISACLYRKSNGLLTDEKLKEFLLEDKKDFSQLNIEKKWTLCGKYYPEIIDYAEKIIGPENLVFLNYRDIKEKPKLFLETIFKKIGHHYSDLDESEIKKERNKLRSNKASLFTQKIKKIFQNTKYYPYLREFYRELFSKTTDTKELNFSEKEKEKLRAIYQYQSLYLEEKGIKF